MSCESCTQRQMWLDATPAGELFSANTRALQAMHDLLVWMWCEGCTKFACAPNDFGGYFETLLVAVEQKGYDAAEDMAAGEAREHDFE